jgi:hypothetical protein
MPMSPPTAMAKNPRNPLVAPDDAMVLVRRVLGVAGDTGDHVLAGWFA